MALSPRLVLWKKYVMIEVCDKTIRSEKILSFFERSWNNICHLIFLSGYMKCCNTGCFACVYSKAGHAEQSAC